MHSFFRVFVRGVLAASCVIVPIVACGGGASLSGDIIPDGGPDGATVEAGPGRNVGEPCSDTDKCRNGLVCNDGKCAPSHASPDGTPCTISAECKDGSYCGPQRTCAPAGTGDNGASCASDGDCKSGLRCNLVGLGAVCQPEGTGDVGAQCKSNADCFGGLACANGACTPLPPGPVPPIAIPNWKGVECKDDMGPVTAYFRVPRNNGEDGDFFRLPFPNDVRLVNGHPAMSGFPTPGSALLGYDVVQRYVDDVQKNADGFSAYTTVTMRFSGEIDFDTLKPQGVVKLIDLTTKNELGLLWAATTGRSAYVCNNSIGIRPRQGEPFEGGKQYAVIISNAAKVKGGGDIAQAPDLGALLDTTQPGAPVGDHWAKYQKLRDWMSANGVTKSQIVNASVFTVGTTKKTFVTDAVPTTSSWTKCENGATSPCPDTSGMRGCPATPSPDFDEYHALVKLPIYQQGTAPYIDPTDGGDFTSSVVREEDVCLSLALPKGTATSDPPVPLVIYAHGTGGSFRSQILDGTATKLMTRTPKMAVLGIDQVQHATRRNGSTKTPDDLFFNFTNPAAARGNPLQGAADQISLVNVAKQGMNGFKFSKILFWGHSQGATEGAIAMTQANVNKSDVSAIVLSGSGASIIDALLTKTSPVNIAAALPFVLNETSGVNDTHPVLSVLQNSIDPADPLNSGRFLDKHVFVPYGQKDTYTPSRVQATYILAAGLGIVQPPAGVTDEPIGTLVDVAPGTSGNLSGRTGLTREYVPSGYDGHFVSQKDNTASENVMHFLEVAAGGTTPPVGTP